MNLSNSPAVRIIGEMYEDKKAAETAIKMRDKGFLLEDIADIVEKPISWLEEQFQKIESNLASTK
jgi:hypothetical protein